jgi:hypothetical protein
MVWGYALLAFLLASLVKILTYRLIEHSARHHVRHLLRVESYMNEYQQRSKNDYWDKILTTL